MLCDCLQQSYLFKNILKLWIKVKFLNILINWIGLHCTELFTNWFEKHATYTSINAAIQISLVQYQHKTVLLNPNLGGLFWSSFCG